MYHRLSWQEEAEVPNGFCGFPLQRSESNHWKWIKQQNVSVGAPSYGRSSRSTHNKPSRTREKNDDRGVVGPCLFFCWQCWNVYSGPPVNKPFWSFQSSRYYRQVEVRSAGRWFGQGERSKNTLGMIYEGWQATCHSNSTCCVGLWLWFQQLDVNEWKTFRKELTKSKSIRKCGKSFIKFCDSNNDKRITFQEWTDCFAILKGKFVQAGGCSR